MPYPVESDAKDRRETTVLNEELSTAGRGFEILQDMCSVGEEGWMLAEDYEYAVAFLKERKEAGAGAESVEEREEIMGHWPWDDMDEKEYM